MSVVGVVAVMRAGPGLRIVRQSLRSLEAFGDLTGRDWRDVSRKHATEDARRVCLAAAEEAIDTGTVVRVIVMSPEPGEFTARPTDSGLLLTTWRPLTLEEKVDLLISWRPRRPDPRLW